jgi:hypothetical protein
MRNPYPRRSFWRPYGNQAPHDQYEAALQGQEDSTSQEPRYSTGSVRRQPDNAVTGSLGSQLGQAAGGGISDQVRSMFPSMRPRTPWGGAGGMVQNYAPPLPTMTPAASPYAGPLDASLYGPPMDTTPQAPVPGYNPTPGMRQTDPDLRYYNELLFRDQLTFAQWMSLVSGKYQRMDENGNLIGDPMMTQAAKQAFVQEFGYDPETREQSLSGQRQALDAQKFAFDVFGTFGGTQRTRSTRSAPRPSRRAPSCSSP